MAEPTDTNRNEQNRDDAQRAKRTALSDRASWRIVQGVGLRIKRFLDRYSIIYAILVVGLVLTLTTGNFLTTNNLVNVLRQISMVSIISVGVFFTLVAGSLDISTGAVVALISVTFSSLMVFYNMSPILAIILSIFLGMFIGLINGLLITRLGIPALIATLAMQYVCIGVVYLSSGGYPISGIPESVVFLGRGHVFDLYWLPWPVFIMVVIVLIAHFISQKTRFGRHIYAVGGNPEAAYLSGIKHKRTVVYAHVICSALAALAGVIVTARLNSGQVKAGEGWDFEAIIGTIIGGVSIVGGRGYVFGAMLGTFLVGLLVNGMTLNNVDSNVQKIVKGVVLLFAIAFDILNVRRRNKS
ncbi:MAG: ABC transporter permease [Clostridiaceae bacterium]|nr:ABC transporter permease [Clostridiaceae bacterium]